MDTTRRAALGGGLALSLAPGFARAQAFPTRPVRIVVPIAPGGANDILARMIAERLSPALGQPVVVENRPGAGGNLGALAVAQAEKDGHTILFTSANVLVANKWLYRTQMPLDPLRDLAPITRVAVGTILLVVNSQRPWQTFQQLVEFARANPGRVTMGSSGTGTISHLFLERLNRAAGIQITHVPYRGGAPAVTDLVAGRVQMIMSPLVEVLAHVQAGRLRPLAVTTSRRSPLLPEVPTIAETVPGFEVALWNGFLAPAGTPAPAIARFAEETAAVLRNEEVRRRLAEQGSEPVGSTPAEFAAFIRAEIPKWTEMVRLSGATAS